MRAEAEHVSFGLANAYDRMGAEVGLPLNEV